MLSVLLDTFRLIIILIAFNAWWIILSGTWKFSICVFRISWTSLNKIYHKIYICTSARPGNIFKQIYDNTIFYLQHACRSAGNAEHCHTVRVNVGTEMLARTFPYNRASKSCPSPAAKEKSHHTEHMVRQTCCGWCLIYGYVLCSLGTRLRTKT